MTSEIWIDIEGYEGLYQVSNFGNVKSLDRTIQSHNKRPYTRIIKGQIMKPLCNGNAYMYVSLWKDGKKKNHYIHRLVATAFVPNDDNKDEVNHKDCDKLNNNMENLEWVTRSENAKHASDNGRMVNCYRWNSENNPQKKGNKTNENC